MYANRYCQRSVAQGKDRCWNAQERALEEGLIKATRLATGQWRIAESAWEEALQQGIDVRGLSKGSKEKGPQPLGLKRFLERKKAEKKQVYHYLAANHKWKRSFTAPLSFV
jgi:hypothetical protein